MDVEYTVLVQQRYSVSVTTRRSVSETQELIRRLRTEFGEDPSNWPESEVAVEPQAPEVHWGITNITKPPPEPSNLSGAWDL